MEPTWKEYRIFAVVGVAVILFGFSLLHLFLFNRMVEWWRLVMPSLAYVGLLALLWYQMRKPRKYDS